MKIVIGHLYGDLMNIYGDKGNIITLKKRCEWRGIKVQVKNISLGTKLKKGDIDLYFFGGGQDQQQFLVAQDLNQNIGKIIKEDIEDWIPLLSICGGYQLLGHYYEPQNSPKIKGIELFPVYTHASNQRMIGNIVVNCESLIVNRENKNDTRSTINDKLTFVGFENHSGKTYLMEGAQPLGKVIKGFGNNGQDKTEGCIYKNAIGCYMHGSLLPKNTKLADWLIQKALEIKYGRKIELKPLDDNLENSAHNKAIQKFG